MGSAWSPRILYMILTSKIYAQADCNSLGDCISDPVSGTRGGNTFSDLSTATVFAINFTLYIVQGFLLVLIFLYIKVHNGGISTSM